ncbi:MAG: CBS domain-containing protein [Candidatus Nitrosopumilus sp. Bin_571-38]
MTRIPQLTEIKKLREELEISQRQLAKKCDIPSSFLSMIENPKNNTKPSYDVLVRIFKELDSESQKNLGKLITAEKIYKKNLTFARKSDYAEDIIKQMHDKDYSQIPVLEGNGCVGLVTENSLVKFLQNREHAPLTTARVKDVMATPPIIIGIHTKITENLLSLFDDSKCLLVSENAKIVGLITKIDAIRGLMKN